MECACSACFQLQEEAEKVHGSIDQLNLEMVRFQESWDFGSSFGPDRGTGGVVTLISHDFIDNAVMVEHQ
eukprot:11897648-Karenia_brevis.AAC.1